VQSIRIHVATALVDNDEATSPESYTPIRKENRFYHSFTQIRKGNRL
jgi:hypothetical protein